MISVIMPVYNESEFIEDAIKSLINQTYQDLEIIVIDDGSTDNTLEIINKYTSHLQVIHHRMKKGISESLNEGIENARGEYIARMDGDDICVNDRFEKQINYLKVHPEIDIVGSFINIIDETGKVIGEECFFEKHEDIYNFCLRTRIDLQHPTVLAKAEVFKKNKYQSKYDGAEDYELFTRLVENYRIENIPEKLLLYRRYDRSNNSDNRKKQMELAKTIANDIAQRRSILNIRCMKLDTDWHNICFYVNYFERLNNKSVIICTSDYYKKWIVQIVEKIQGCVCTYSITDNELFRRNIKLEQNEYLILATEKWWEIKEKLINSGWNRERIIFAFFCRRLNMREKNEQICKGIVNNSY